MANIDNNISISIEKIISVIEINSKVYKPKTYKEVISNPIPFEQWKKANEKEIQNLENYQTWEYNRLSVNQKTVGFKQVFKVKYTQNDSIAWYKVQLIIQDFF